VKWLKSYPFWICVVFASILWFFLYLSNTVELKLKLNVNYNNLPDGYVVANTSDNTIPVTLFVKGNEVNRTKEVFNDFYVAVDMGFVQTKDSLDILNVSYSPAFFAKPQINTVLKSNPNFNITIDSVYVDLERSLTKKVPLVSDFTYFVPKTYIIASNSGFNVDSVVITGLINEIEQFDEIHVGKRNFGLVNKPISIDVNLEKLYPQISIDPEMIHFALNVQLATEGKIEIKIKDSDNPSYYFFPENINVKFSTSVEDFDDVSVEDFVIKLDYLSSSTENRALVYLVEYPATIKLVNFEPDYVEYYLFEE
jgi:hypothetical protein